MIKFYYGPEYTTTQQYKVAPAPQLTINTQLDYSNDSITGYSYSININGFVTTYDQDYIEIVDSGILQEESPGPIPCPIPGPASGLIITENSDLVLITENAITNTIDSSVIANPRSIRQILIGIEKIKRIFSRNGSCLTIQDDKNNNLLKAKGGTLQSISFNQSDNNWINSCPYSIEIIFNELEILDEEIVCNTSLIHPSSRTNNLVDITKHKIKNFTDNWSFDVADEYYNYMYTSLSTCSINPNVINSGCLYPCESGYAPTSNVLVSGHFPEICNDAIGTYVLTSGLSLFNSEISFNYSLSATGKNYYIHDQLSPAWVQAKNFVQERLYHQVRGIAKILAVSSGGACDPTYNLNDLHNIDNSGLLYDINNYYKLYNETLTCSCSESEGSFSAEYNAVLKRNMNNEYSSSNVRHTMNKNVSTSLTGTKKNISISIEGEIEGLCEGGIIQHSGVFSFPSSGTILKLNNTSTKYNNANQFLTKIFNQDLTDFNDTVKSGLGITLEALELQNSISCTGIKPVSFNLTRNYMIGTISYNVEYSSDRCGIDNGDTTVFNTTISAEEPTPILAEFAIPNGDYIIQDIGTFTARKISVSAEGRKARQCCFDPSFNSYLEYIMTSDMETLFPFLILPDENVYILTSKNFSQNLLEGTYNVNLSYTCGSGCAI